jgi:ABC-type uncharacterized transport system permease subunit
MVAVGIGFVGLWLVFLGAALLVGWHWAWAVIVAGVFVAMFGFGAVDVDKTTTPGR